jgi:LysM repeat protein
MNNIEISYKYTSSDTLISAQQLNEKLRSTLREEQRYEVASGDTVESIALQHGMSSSDLISMNAGLDNNSLKAGDEIVVKTSLSLLSIKKTKTIVYSEDIAYETETVNDSTMYEGKSKTVTKGVTGEKTDNCRGYLS